MRNSSNNKTRKEHHSKPCGALGLFAFRDSAMFCSMASSSGVLLVRLRMDAFMTSAVSRTMFAFCSFYLTYVWLAAL